MPKISVIIPSYNHEKFVSSCIKSILNQTYQDFEVVITDDGSSDKTVEEIKKIKDPRISLNVFKQNRGAGVASNDCLKRARGEYIAALSSDDEFLPYKLELQAEFLDKNPEIGAVFGKPNIIDEDGNLVQVEHPYCKIFNQENRTQARWLSTFFRFGNCLCNPSVLIRKECYDKVGCYDPFLHSLADFDFWVRFLFYYKIHILDEILINFRILQNEKNASGIFNIENKNRQILEFSHILKYFVNDNHLASLPRIFPEIALKFLQGNPSYNKWLVYQKALEFNTNQHNLFALQGMKELFKSNEIVSFINHKESIYTESYYGELTGKCKISENIDVTFIQVYYSSNTYFTEGASVKAPIVSNNWEIIKLDFTVSPNCFKIRLDPINRVGLVDFSYIKILDEKGKVIWDTQHGCSSISFGESVFLVEQTNSGSFKCFSTGCDPHIFISSLFNEMGSGRFTFIACLKFTNDYSFLNEVLASLPDLEAQAERLPELEAQIAEYESEEEDLSEELQNVIDHHEDLEALVRQHAAQSFRQHCLRPINPLRKFTCRKLQWLDKLLPRAELRVDALPIAYNKKECPGALKEILDTKQFDAAWYLETYTDVKQSKLSPFHHYLKHGWREGKNPSPHFNVTDYLTQRSDVAQAGIEPLTHFLKYGQNHQ